MTALVMSQIRQRNFKVTCSHSKSHMKGIYMISVFTISIVLVISILSANNQSELLPLLLEMKNKKYRFYPSG